MRPTDRNIEFLREFRDLLEKYNASIVWNCHWSSDLHSVTDRKMIINVGQDAILSVGGDSIYSFDLLDD